MPVSVEGGKLDIEIDTAALKNGPTPFFELVVELPEGIPTSESIHRRGFIVSTAKAIMAAVAITAVLATASLLASENKPATDDVTARAPHYPLFAVDKPGDQPYLELGKPNPAIPFTAGPCAVYGRYTADGKITFAGRCVNPWEFMVTGTGVSGLAIAAAREVTAQINHSAAFDEQDMLRSLGRLRLDWYDFGAYRTVKRFSGLEKEVRMVHDLQRSVITISSEGGQAKIRLEVRAHKELDVVRIDFFEESSVPQAKGGDAQLIEKGLLPWASEALTCFRNRYPKKAANGRTDFTPSINGESYLAATDCTELLVGMKSLLPRLLALGQSRGWEQATLALWRQMYEDLPDLPRGSIVIHKKFADDKFSGSFITSHGWGSPLSLEKSELLAPVRQLSPAYSQAYDRENPELYSIWPGKLMLRDKKDRDVAIRSYHARLFQNVPAGWSVDGVIAACLGLKEEVKRFWPYYFDTAYTYPCGLAQEYGPSLPDKVCCSFNPSMQGLGTGLIPVLEMLLTDYPDLLVVVPCWESEVAVRNVLYSPYAGRVMVDYDPKNGASVKTERPIKVEFGEGIQPAKN